jgi:2-polyprenyl-3-methyl-5-hydroxy-6-metoxy-1,4-benzoquinol methylase
MSSRKFNWISSIDSHEEDALKKLNKAMAVFYSAQDSRVLYNQMIQGVKDGEDLDEVTLAFLEWYNTKKTTFKNVLEIGCGTGRIRKQLLFPANSIYTGTEVSEKVIFINKQKWPDSIWLNKSVYDLEFGEKRFDLIYSFYVLEHLVFPEKALNIMLNLLAPGGNLVIICPDFCSTKRLPSQQLGFSHHQRALLKFREGKWLDGLISLYDSKLRLSKALRHLSHNPGRYMINMNPICLDLKVNENVWPDCDAVYIANKNEIEFWAKKNHLNYYYPKGKSGIFEQHIFIVISKSST